VRQAPLLLLLLMTGIVGCDRTRAPRAAVAPDVTMSPAGVPDAYPTKDEVLDYLDGKTIAQSLEKGTPQFVLKREQVEALEVEQGGTMVSNGPWVTSVTFIANSGDGRYAVRLTVQHRPVEDKRAFFGFTVQEVAKQ